MCFLFPSGIGLVFVKYSLPLTRALLRLERTMNLIQGRGGGGSEGGRGGREGGREG